MLGLPHHFAALVIADMVTYDLLAAEQNEVYETLAALNEQGAT